jgi:hypothetical protein
MVQHPLLAAEAAAAPILIIIVVGLYLLLRCRMVSSRNSRRIAQTVAFDFGL